MDYKTELNKAIAARTEVYNRNKARLHRELSSSLRKLAKEDLGLRRTEIELVAKAGGMVCGEVDDTPWETNHADTIMAELRPYYRRIYELTERVSRCRLAIQIYDGNLAMELSGIGGWLKCQERAHARGLEEVADLEAESHQKRHLTESGVESAPYSFMDYFREAEAARKERNYVAGPEPKGGHRIGPKTTCDHPRLDTDLSDDPDDWTGQDVVEGRVLIEGFDPDVGEGQVSIFDAIEHCETVK